MARPRKTARSTRDYARQMKNIEQTGVVVMHHIARFSAYNRDIFCPHMALMIIESGYTRVLYDMQEVTKKKNEFSCLLRGHILHPIENSEDFSATILLVSNRIADQLPFHTFSHDYNKFNQAPTCILTSQQAERLQSITEQIEAIAKHTDRELPHKQGMILSLLAIGYEYLNLYRHEQDRNLHNSTHAGLLNRFCDMVVKHYKQEREAKFYATQLKLTPRNLAKIIRSQTGGMSPSDWIEQFVAARAKHILSTNKLTVKETSYALGFTEASSFCRFFKRVAGMTPQDYRDSLR